MSKPGPTKGDADRKRAEAHRDYLRRNISAWILITKRGWSPKRAAEKLQLNETALREFIDCHFRDIKRRLDRASQIDVTGS